MAPGDCYYRNSPGSATGKGGELGYHMHLVGYDSVNRVSMYELSCSSKGLLLR